MTENPPTSLVARCPEDLLAMVPIVIGFPPQESVVMLTFGARDTFHARVDLPDRAEDLEELVRGLVGPARRNGVTSVVFVLYDEDADRAHRAWRALRRGFRAARIQVIDALRTDGARWYPLLGGDARSREEGVPYDISGHPFVARAVLAGRVTRGSRAEVEALLAQEPARAAEVEALVDDGPVPGPGWVGDLVARHVGARTSPDDGEVARLLPALAVGERRDEAVTGLDRVSAQRHVDLWLDVLRRTPTAYVAPVAALLGLAAWQLGDGALAWCAVDRCAEVDPDHPLMLFLASALTHALPPSAWTPGEELSAS